VPGRCIASDAAASIRISRYRGNDSECGEGFLHPPLVLFAWTAWWPLDPFSDSTILLANVKNAAQKHQT